MDKNLNDFGYCCICLSLKDKGVSTNRGMVKKTFLEKGIEYVSELSLKNTDDLIKIMKWNSDNKIRMYRMSSDIFPWCSEYEIPDLPMFNEIQKNLEEAGRIAKENGVRLSFHPSPYCVMGSNNEDVVKKSIKELRQHSEIMDIMNLERSHYYPINIHINTANPSKLESSDRFCRVFESLEDGVKNRLVIENDDKSSLFTPKDLYEMVHSKIGIPITFDYLHYKCHPDPDISEEESLKMCLSTWPNGIRPLTHYSDSRRIHEDPKSKLLSHSDWIHNRIDTYGLEFSIELEVKMKDLALLKYLDNFII